MSINGIGATGYPSWSGTRKAESGTKGDFGTNVKVASGTKNVVHIDPDALFSIYDAKTGESANVHRADDYSEEHPLYVVKGRDKNGNEYEQTVDVSKVNPNNCSYTEMLALNAHTGNKSDSNFLSMAIMKDKAGTSSYQEKADYLSAAYALMHDMKTLGNWDGYLRYDKWIDDILTFCKSNTGQFYQQKQAIDESVSESTRQNANVQDIYKAFRTTNPLKGQEESTVSETVQARFPLQKVDEEGNRKEDIYLIAVDKDGIRCSKAGQDEYEWEILFTDESQYENATEFLNYAGKFMDNFLFAAHENFWEDYLNGNMDVDAFKEFLEGTNNGIPDYSFTVGDSMYIDKEKMQWAQYMNPLGIKFYTGEEMAQMQAELIEKNTAAAHKLSDPYSILYKKLNPEYNGERIFCEYPGGPLYTADEIMEIMNRNSTDAKYQAGARK